MLESSALAAALSQSVPGLLDRFEKEYQTLKNGPGAQKFADTSSALDSLIHRLKQIYGPLEN
jgi:hypothetical protein